MSARGEPFPRSEPIFESKGATYRLAALRGTEMAPLLPLFHDAFGHGDFSPEWFGRKYAYGHGGVSAFACVAFDEDGQAAGSVGLLPWPVRYGDRVEVAGQMVDVATSSAHRGRGLFVRLAELVRELCEAAGVAFLYGFPNEAAYPIWINKLGYAHSDDLVEYRLPVRTVWAERLAQRAGPLQGAYDAHVGRALARRAPDDPVLENSLVVDGLAGIGRDREFHAYKSAFGGSRVVSLDGGRVWLRVKHGLQIGDLEASSEEDLERSVRALQRLAARLGVHQILFQASKDTRFSRVFGERFRTFPALPVIHRNLSSEIPAEKLRYSFGDLDNF